MKFTSYVKFLLLKKRVSLDLKFNKYTLVSARSPKRVGKATMIKPLIGELSLESFFKPDKINPLKVACLRCDSLKLDEFKDL